MTDITDGLSNIYKIQTNIEALKNAQQNSAAALNTSGSTGKSQSDIDSFLLQNEKSFNGMLDLLVNGSDQQNDQSSSSDIFSGLDTGQNPAVSTTDLKQLEVMEQYSPLIGRTATYFDPTTGEQKSGIISQITFDANASALLVFADGSKIAAGAVIGLK